MRINGLETDMAEKFRVDRTPRAPHPYLRLRRQEGALANTKVSLVSILKKPLSFNIKFALPSEG